MSLWAVTKISSCRVYAITWQRMEEQIGSHFGSIFLSLLIAPPLPPPALKDSPEPILPQPPFKIAYCVSTIHFLRLGTITSMVMGCFKTYQWTGTKLTECRAHIHINKCHMCDFYRESVILDVELAWSF